MRTQHDQPVGEAAANAGKPFAICRAAFDKGSRQAVELAGAKIFACTRKRFFECDEPSGPITYGTTYSVRPFIEPSNSPFNFVYASSGAIQLLLGPASSFFGVQMKVRCSTRATSFGFERCR